MPATLRNITEASLIPAECSERFLPLEEPWARPLRERGVIQAGLSELRAPFEIGRRESEFHAVLYTIEGGARVETPASRVVLRPGDLWIAPSGHAYRYRAGSRWKVLWFHLADSPRWAGLRSRGIGVHPSPPLRALCHATEEFLAETIHAQGDAADIARAYAEVIGVYLDRLGREALPPAQARELRSLNSLWQSIDADLAFPWSVGAIAARLHLSPTHLHRLALRHYQATPMQIVARLRMRRAAEMLRGSDDTIELIALSIGYSTPVSFSRAFVRHFGHSPGKFRAGTGRASQGSRPTSACANQNQQQ